MPGVAADLDDPAVPAPDVVEHREQRAELGVAADERRLGGALVPRAGDRADERGLHGLGLALARNGSIGVVSKSRARALEDDLRREDLPGVGACS